MQANSEFIDSINETYFNHEEELKLLERALEISSKELMHNSSQMRAVFDAFPDIFLRVNLDGKILDYKSADIEISNYFPDQIIGRHLREILVLQVDNIVEELIHRTRSTNKLVTIEHSAKHKNKNIHFEIRLKSLLDDQVIIILRDITERKLAEEQLKYDALHDRLTQLPNRSLLLESLRIMIQRKKRHPEYNFAVIFVDFDRFKMINDSLGHLVGDTLLVEISKRLRNTIRSVDVLARLSGDEFCIVLDEIKDEKDVVIAANRLLQLSETPYLIDDRKIYITLSAGIAVSNTDETRTESDYIRDSDIAMYVAKKSGRSKYVFYDSEMKAQAIRNQSLESDFRRAIDNMEFQLYYQPIVSLDTKKVLRMEALVRWIHPEKGMIPPNDFIPLAEETGLIYPLGEFVLLKACEECHSWQTNGFKGVGVAVNFSSLQFQFANVQELIKKAVEKIKLDPSALEIEITESILMRNVYHTTNLLTLLREMGVKVAIDDFGTGYSSLGSLSELPIDSLKIDRKFMHNLPHNRQNVLLTTAIIGLAHNLGLKVVGEGIENHEQLNFLHRTQCDEGQGYLFSKPKPTQEILKLIKDSKLF